MKKTNQLIFSVLSPLLVFQAAVADSPSSNMLMRFNKPAEAYGEKSPLESWKVENQKRTHKPNPDQAWEKYALPLGNGFIGAMVYGGTSYERVQINEHSLWSGGPGSPGYLEDQNIKDAYKSLPKMRELLLKGDKKSLKEAEKMSRESMRGIGPDDRDLADRNFGRYQTLGELIIKTTHPEFVNNQNYSRQLDLSSGVQTITYQHDGAAFTRESFCSYPDRVLVLNFSADKPAKQNLSLTYNTPHIIKPTAEKNVFIASGKVDNNGLKVEMRIGVLHDGGNVSVTGNGIEVKGADSVSFVVVAGTDYQQIFPNYRGDHPAAKNKSTLSAAMSKGFATLKANNIKDHSGLQDRVSVDWGTTPDDILKRPLDERLKLNQETADHDLEELYFQFGRYLLISSSRPGSLPANLQGIWCNETVPAWNSDYHFNINLQMNYWPAGPTNLLECQEPFISYTDGLRAPGARTAKAYSNARGWTCNLSGNIWGCTTPNPGKSRPGYWAWAPLSGGWLSTHAFEQYAFGLDADYLRKTSWPIISESADFIVDYLYRLPTGELSSTPSWSPEHGPISKGTTSDMGMAREALKGAIAAAHVLGEKGKRVNQWEAALKDLVPYKVGKHGQLQEWYEDIDKPKDKHRHLNHLFGLYPGSQINPVHTPKLAEAAKVTLTQRGDGAVGWSMGWKINFWARIQDGDHAYLMVRNLLKNGTNPNLLDVIPPFQIDGNFGGCAGIAEMFMQSHYRSSGGEIDLLPALPSDWPTGSFKGLLARGGFVVDASWKGGKITAAQITARKGGELTVRYNGKVVNKTMKAGQVINL